MQLINNIFIGFVVAGKSENEEFEEWELTTPYRPRFGRNWWFWWPTLRTNGGRFKHYENTDINFQWLCYSLSLTVFARRKKDKS